MNKKLTIAIILFASIFFISIVYALAIGSFNFSGTATLLAPGDIDLRIVDADFSSSTPRRIEAEFEETVDVPAILDYKTINISVDLLYPLDKRIIVFKIENIEALAVQLGSLIIHDEPDIETTGVRITWPELDGLIILAGQTSAEYEIIVEWDLDYYDAGNTGVHNFSATIGYLQAP